MCLISQSEISPVAPWAEAPRAAYVHVPFCARRCGYCNFTLIVGRRDLEHAYLKAIECELAAMVEPQEVDTLFLGGGTPTQLRLDRLEALLQLVMQWHPLAPGAEVSIEANPADLSPEVIDLLAGEGVTRLSIGAQSFDAAKLRHLERDHRPEDVYRGVEFAAGRFESISLDLIFATPNETEDVWGSDVAKAIKLPVEHVSTYGLTFERGTTFYSRLLRGDLREADESAARSQYEHAISGLTAAGFEHYEVSNFATPGHRCRHNEVYWTGRPYWAVGPGAARYVEGRREVNHRSTTTWMKRVLAGESPVAESECLSPEDRAREMLVLGLRRIEGVERAAFESQTGFSVDDFAGSAVRRHVELGLMADDGNRVRLTHDGLMISDALWPEYLRM